LNFKATRVWRDLIAPLGDLHTWVPYRSGTKAVLVEFANEAKMRMFNSGAVTKSLLIFRAGDNEVLRITGTWLDGFDLCEFQADSTHSLIVALRTGVGVSTLAVQRRHDMHGDTLEITPCNFVPVPPSLNVLVRLTDSSLGDVLFESEFILNVDQFTLEPAR
jgi:hypothetical protein